MESEREMVMLEFVKLFCMTVADNAASHDCMYNIIRNNLLFTV